MTTVGIPEPFTKITVKGRITLGLAHELLQEPRSDLRDHYYSRGTGWERELDGLAVGHDDVLGQILQFKFSDHIITEPIEIKDDGLVTSFGIFGAPGCGKTVLLMHMLEQVLAHRANDEKRRYGALILDPKASMRRDVTEMASRAGRFGDLQIINTDFMKRHGKRLNVIGCTLDPYELGAILVLAGRSAGIDASDPFWFQEWTNLFASSLSILRTEEELSRPASERRPVTLVRLLDAVCDEMPEPGPDGRRERVIQHIARTLAQRLEGLAEDKRKDLHIDLQTLRRFFSQDYVATVEAFTTKAFGMFRRSRLQCYSDNTPLGDKPPFYEDIVDRGKIVLVSVSPSEPVLAKTLCTLVKCLFQRTVLARGELLSAGTITNRERPLVMACDEYSEIASEVAGQSMGDGQFLALARQYGCMAILATQSVNVLQASSLKETWRSVFSNFAAKIYMRLVDNETAEEATKLAGESDWKVVSQGNSLSGNGTNISTQRDLRERKNLPSSVLTHVLKRGQAVVIGSLDGGETIPGTYYMSVPKPKAADQQSPSRDNKSEAVAHA